MIKAKVVTQSIKAKVQETTVKAKVQASRPENWHDTSQTTVSADVMLSPYTAIDANGNLVTGKIETRNKYDVNIFSWDIAGGQLIINVDASSGYYPENVSNTYMFTIADYIRNYIALPRGTKDTDTVQFRKVNGKWVGEIVT